MLICSIFLLFYLEIKTESVPVTKADGILEVIDNSEYGPLFLASGNYEYDVQLHEQPNTDAIESGTLVFDNKHCTFEIHKDSENPDILSLGILYSTASSFSYYGFTSKK